MSSAGSPVKKDDFGFKREGIQSTYIYPSTLIACRTYCTFQQRRTSKPSVFKVWICLQWIGCVAFNFNNVTAVCTLLSSVHKFFAAKDTVTSLVRFEGTTVIYLTGVHCSLIDLKAVTLVLTHTSSESSIAQEAITRSSNVARSFHLKIAVENASLISQLVSACFLVVENHLLLCFRLRGMGLPRREPEVLFEEINSSHTHCPQTDVPVHWIRMRSYLNLRLPTSRGATFDFFAVSCFSVLPHFWNTSAWLR